MTKTSRFLLLFLVILIGVLFLVKKVKDRGKMSIQSRQNQLDNQQQEINNGKDNESISGDRHSSKKTEKKKQPKKTVSPKPFPLPTGAMRFNISGSAPNEPNLTEVVVNPLDAKIGEKQVITFKMKDKIPLVSFSIKMNTDHKTKTLPMKLVKGSKTTGTWETEWIVNDSHNYKYSMEINAIGQKGKTKGKIEFR